MSDVSFTERELDIMSVLWKRGSGTVAEVREALKLELGYTSVLKMLQILEGKGHIRHEPEGRAYRYFPTVDAREAGASALSRIVDRIFHGSAELTLARLVSDREISSEELDRMRRVLDDLEDAGAGGAGAEEDETAGRTDLGEGVP
jgi:BlaI family transcriptional regulator, penicillinase repressor